MNKSAIAVILAMCTLSATAVATDMPAATSYDGAKKMAEARYSDDKKICAEESTSSLRMQCLRDAKTEHNKALAKARETYGEPKAAATEAKPAVCNECGKVTNVSVVEKKGESNAAGLIAGGVVGGLLGNQVGAGRGRTVATVAGAAGGAYAGKKIQENRNATKSWVVTVHFESGNIKDYSFESDPGYVAGDPVRASGSGIVRR
jgi:outer membrane lipoprotein SlyB